MMRTDSTRRIARAAAALALLATAPLIATAADSSPNTLDPQDHTIPRMQQAQQAQYRHLQDIWMQRHVPTGLPGPERAASARDSGVNAVGIEARDVDFQLDDGVGFYVKRLKAALVPRYPGQPVSFDDPEQYRIHIYSGEVLIRPKDLDALFNNYVLSYEPRALSSVENHTSKDTLKVTVGARLFRFIPPVGGLPTTLSGPIKVGKHNWLIYTPTSVKSLGLPLKPLLSLTHMSLATLTPFDRPGVKLDGNQLLMDPERLFPPPELEIDHIDSARLSDAGLTLTFSSPHGKPDFSPPPVKRDSYIWLDSGDARFYGTVLVNTRLELLHSAKGDLKFNLYHYRAQTAAGRIDSQADGTLIVRVPNHFDDDNDASPEITENAAPESMRQ